MDRIWDGSSPSTLHHEILIPIEDLTTYQLLSESICTNILSAAERFELVLVDSRTAQHVEGLSRLGEKTDHVIVAGEQRSSIEFKNSPTIVEAPPGLTGDELFMIIISPHLSAAIICEPHPGLADGLTLTGGWTGVRKHAVAAALSILEHCGVDNKELISDSSADLDNAPPIQFFTRIMADQARDLACRHHDLARARADLFSVLAILKAISARRRAHDILYVFVEQIARVVESARCSVVRVWGGDSVGHVLASHEDERINDLRIDLDKYPEICRVLDTQAKVVVNDASNDPLTKNCADDIGAAGISAIIVIPVVLYDQNVGSFLLRAVRADGPFSLREISFCEIVAEAAANALERAHLFESIQKANERLEFLAVTDGLTGLYNHRYFRERLSEEFIRTRRYNLELSMLILDVDNFKRVNDNYGHVQGDAVLREISARIMRSVRKIDIVARYGGEEIVVLMPQTAKEGAASEAERIRESMECEPFSGMRDNDLVTVSIGVATCTDGNVKDAETLIRLADSALYEAKNTGKNKVAVAQIEGDSKS